jgi:F-type H+-transporting ATPase subunit delta
VFELAEREGAVEKWSGRLAGVSALFSDPEVVDVLSNPTIPRERREAVIVDAHVLDQEGTNLARLLVESGRIGDAAAIEEEFRRRVDEAAGRVRATVTTAIALDEDDRDRVARELSKRLDKEVRIDVVVDPRILGGMKLQYGDRLVDATVATRLEQLRRRLAAS